MTYSTVIVRIGVSTTENELCLVKVGNTETDAFEHVLELLSKGTQRKAQRLNLPELRRTRLGIEEIDCNIINASSATGSEDMRIDERKAADRMMRDIVANAINVLRRRHAVSASNETEDQLPLARWRFAFGRMWKSSNRFTSRCQWLAASPG